MEGLRALEAGSLPDVKRIYSSKELVQRPVQVGSSKDLFSFPLNVAVASGHEKVVAYLLKAGADPNSADHVGRTPLFEIPRDLDGQSIRRIVRMLVSASADPNLAEPVLGSTPLMQAAMYGDVSLVRSLIENGAELELRDSHGRTALDQVASLMAVAPDEDRVLRELLTKRTNRGESVESEAAGQNSLPK
jgi:ankyrin repeat protein